MPSISISVLTTVLNPSLSITAASSPMPLRVDLFTIENGLTTLSMRPNSPIVCISVLAVSLLSEVFIPLVFVIIDE